MAKNYIGTGTIRRVMPRPNEPLLEVELQIDIYDPERWKGVKEQEVPHKSVKFGD